MHNCYNSQGVTVKTVYYSIGKSPQAATANIWLNVWIRHLRSSSTLYPARLFCAKLVVTRLSPYSRSICRAPAVGQYFCKLVSVFRRARYTNTSRTRLTAGVRCGRVFEHMPAPMMAPIQIQRMARLKRLHHLRELRCLVSVPNRRPERKRYDWFASQSSKIPETWR